MPAAAIASVAAPVIGGIIGNEQAKDSRSAAQKARDAALAQFAGLQLPSIDDQKLALEQYQSTGQLTPEMQQLINLGPSSYENVNVDPRLRSEQIKALESISGLASGNVTPADMAGFELARRNVAGEAQAKQNQILQDMQARGQGGSGAELIARLNANQSSADRLAQQQMEEAKAIQNARMQALAQQSNMAGNLRTQDYSEQARLADARDAIARFNAQNAQQVEGSNVGTRNQAQAANLQNAQAISKANTDLRNQQQTHNKGLLQQQFANQMRKAGQVAGQYSNQADENDKAASRTAAMYATIGQGIGGGIQDFMQGQKADAQQAFNNQQAANLNQANVNYINSMAQNPRTNGK